jgi:hypothetical protein
MNLSEYFENTEGTGVLATADSAGNVVPLFMPDLIVLMNQLLRLS